MRVSTTLMTSCLLCTKHADRRLRVVRARDALATACGNVPEDALSVQQAVRAVQMGQLVVVVDDTGREDEADLIMAAQFATASDVAFFVKHTSGVLCCALPQERAQLLELPPMVRNNTDAHQTAFTVSVDAASHIGTGISATDRAHTLHLLAYTTHPNAFTRPGHVFPLVAHPMGLAKRRGHTEAAVELCLQAGVRPVAALSELVSPCGVAMASRAEAQDFATEHGLPYVTVDALARARAS